MMNKCALFALGLLCTGVVSVYGQNILKNGDFENGFTD